jgi:hypothetical protein
MPRKRTSTSYRLKAFSDGNETGDLHINFRADNLAAAQAEVAIYLRNDKFLEGILDVTLVCTENLNPGIVVMESAEDGERFDASGPLNRARNRRIFVQRPMRSDVVVIACVGLQNSA